MIKGKAILSILCFALVLMSANNPGGKTDKAGCRLNIVFYNVENLFDTLDSDLDDDEFLPSSERRWNTYKYYRKLNNLYKVISLCGKNNRSPDIIGLCEVENNLVLEDLSNKTPLFRDNYDYVISGGHDERGISTALLFRKDCLNVLKHESWYPVDDKGNYIKTRSVLYCALDVCGETLHIIVCHWPSRRGGVTESEGRRRLVGRFIKEKLQWLDESEKIIIMGDMNDEPGSLSINEDLYAIPSERSSEKARLVNVTGSGGGRKGSYKYQGSWFLFDQIIISGSLLDPDSGLYYIPGSFSIINSDVLLTEDKAHRGSRPFSTWWGYRYEGGYSDHLPVRIELEKKNGF